MEKKMKYWVKFWMPGTIVAESWNQEFESLPDPRRVSWPRHAYAFTVHQREDIVDKDKEYQGKPEQVGPMYYHPDSKIETLEEVKQNPNTGPALVSNMECNGWDRIIWTRWKNWPQPFKEGEMLVL